MNIAFIVGSLVNKGPIVLVRDLVKSLRNHAQLIKVYYFDDIRELEFDCPTQKISFYGNINFDHFDIIHSHGFRPDMFVYFNRRKIQGKAFSTCHNYMADELRYTYGWLAARMIPRIWRLFLSKHDKVVTLSKDMLDYYLELGIPASKLEYVYNSRWIEGNPDSEISKKENLNIEAFREKYIVIGMIAGLTKRKGVHQIVNALYKRGDLGLLLVGDGPELKNIEKMSTSVREQVMILGYKNNAQKYLPYFDIYAMASYSEGFPLVLIEAGLHKLKVICSDIPVFKELFTEKEVVFFELDNTESLIKAIDSVLKDESKGINLFSLIEARYNLRQMGDRYSEIYQKVI